ncbi:sensor histidine kinase RegB [Roseicyclus persicicus]|uniref:histidine kinase n=1 Tax=Roseicyclus persicicus TaxID=2650661 RepID=A0A7X6JZK8_9RHOB|nr:ActS/PrrB/RegB family redox-sensitive histidine kinase [Roseibacterium persicicum]NKX45280.1 ActS/PrrB/RegB family redox-sensitive histidine kinase [Roseibacterium persicicum]
MAIATPDPALDLVSQDARSDWVRLRTLLVLRWLAILGQTITVVVAAFYLGLRVELGLCFLAIGASVISNLIAMTIFPENQRLSDRDAMLTLLFDLSQLSFLLFLTGGLNNPFALLILAPVTISATALTVRSTTILGVLAVAMITLLALFHVPLTTAGGEVLQLPDIFIAGFWISITIGIVFLSAYARRITSETHSMSQALLATQMALAREQKLTDLGGVVAAAAHELGTPLATIKLVSTELVEELSDHPELAEDARLIRDQADRCRDILRSMGRAGKDDLHMRSAPFGAVVREAAEPHAGRGIDVQYDFAGDEGEPQGQPVIWRKPEVIHGLRNLVQNAVDFAQARIWVEGSWGDGEIRLRITDDGPGYPQDLLGRLGDPFLSRRARAQSPDRPGYEGMGLGLFIAKTLLERSGARVTFWNASDPFLSAEDKSGKSGAIVEVIWPHQAIGLLESEATGPLGENQPIAI